MKKDIKHRWLYYIGYRTNSAKVLIEYLYGNASIYLDRKFKNAQKIAEIYIKQRKNYTLEEKQIIQKFYHSFSKDQFFRLLPNREWYSIQQKAHQLNLHKYNIKKS